MNKINVHSKHINSLFKQLHLELKSLIVSQRVGSFQFKQCLLALFTNVEHLTHPTIKILQTEVHLSVTIHETR